MSIKQRLDTAAYIETTTITLKQGKPTLKQLLFPIISHLP